MESYLYWLSIIPILITVLLVHESGHLIAAKAFGVKTLELGIGFPPRIAAFATGNTRVMISEQTQFIIDKELTEQIPKDLKKGELARITSIEQEDGTLVAHTIELRGKSGWRKGKPENPPEHLGPSMHQRGRIRSATETEIRIADMEWSINLIPLGAFVGLHEDRSQRSATALNSKPSWQRATVIIAGIAANLVFPIIPIFIATVIHTGPTSIQVVEVQPDSPAEKAGMAPGDVIIAINNQQHPTLQNIRDTVATSETADLIIITSGQPPRTVTITPTRTTQEQPPLIGITATHIRAGPWRANAITSTPQRAASNTGTLYREFYSEINSWFTGNKKPELAGIVGIVEQTAQVVETSNLVGYLIVTAVLSVNIGIVNILPIAPLDGGRLAVLAFESTRRGRLISQQTEMKIAGMGLILIGVIAVWLAISDVSRLMEQ